MKIKIPAKPETQSRLVSVRFTPSEYGELAQAAAAVGLDVAPFIRVVVANAVRLGVELAD